MPRKVLIIDDEMDMRVFLETLFKKAGFVTDVAANGDEALRQLADNRPDLITLDIIMPKKSGLSFFDVINKDDSWKDIPVIVLSGVTGHADFFEGVTRSGAIEFIDKPVKPELLLNKVKQMLGE